MSPCYRFKSIIAVLAVLMTCMGNPAGGVALPTIDNNYTDDGAVVRDPSFESEAASEEQLEKVIAPSPAMLYYLEMTRNRIRQPTADQLFTRKGSQPKSTASLRPVAALMREMSEGRSKGLRRRRDGFSLDRGIAWIRKRSAGARAILPRIAYENTAAGAVQTGYFGKGDVDCDEGLRRLDGGCRRLSLKASSEDEDEEEDLRQTKEKRREFVVDLGKRFDEFRVDLGKRFILNND